MRVGGVRVGGFQDFTLLLSRFHARNNRSLRGRVLRVESLAGRRSGGWVYFSRKEKGFHFP